MNLLPEVNQCAWECRECGVIVRTNLDATSENTGVPCPTDGCFHPNDQNWIRRKDLETPIGKLKAQIKRKVGLKP